MSANELTSVIKQKAIEIGFAACGISKARPLRVEGRRLKHWLGNNLHGSLDYLEKNPDVRTNPGRIVENACSVISLLYNYYPEQSLPAENNLRIARYAYGKDYHVLIKRKLNELISTVKTLRSYVSARGFVDSAPVMEKALAQRSGLGWIGKNTLLIHPQMGSFFFLAEIITDLELETDTPQSGQCGSCQRCLDACPTGALVAPYIMDVRRCIAYLTIEYDGKLPSELRSRFNQRIFGCDACQEVCPYNRLATPHHDPELLPGQKLTDMQRGHWLQMTNEEFDSLFRHSAIHRVTYPRLKRNIDFISVSS